MDLCIFPSRGPFDAIKFKSITPDNPDDPRPRLRGNAGRTGGFLRRSLIGLGETGKAQKEGSASDGCNKVNKCGFLKQCKSHSKK